MSIGVFVGTLIYKFVLEAVKKMIFKKVKGGNCVEEKRYERVRGRFRNRFDEKLNVYDVDGLMREEEGSNGSNAEEIIDQKLLNTVRISTIQRVIEEYP
jgi:hypothetical protein